MALKPLNDWAGRLQSDATKVNNDDKDAKGDFVTDGYPDGNPNAQGPKMRPLYDATAGHANHPTDLHDEAYPAPYPRIQKGAVAQGSRSARFRGRTGDDERSGVSGKWPQAD